MYIVKASAYWSMLLLFFYFLFIENAFVNWNLIDAVLLYFILNIHHTVITIDNASTWIKYRATVQKAQ